MSVKNLKDLMLYKKCVELRCEISDFSKKKLPKEEKFRLKDQIIRSSRSVTANIAEGHGRFHYQENIQYVRMARGSLLETQDHIDVAFEELYLVESEYKKLTELIDHCTRLINGYLKYLKDKKIGVK